MYTVNSPYPRIKKLWGLLEYKLQWTLTLRGWLLILLSFFTFFTVILTQIQPFLAIQAPIKADALLIEGWVADRVIQGAVEEFNKGNYKVIIATGSPIYRGSFLTSYKNYAELTAATLTHLDVDTEKIIVLPTPDVVKDRTAAAATMVKEWLAHSNLGVQSLNIYSFDVHTRRSWFIYQKVLGDDIGVGAISYPNMTYESNYWWASSAGFRSVTDEAIAYFYAKFIWRS